MRKLIDIPDDILKQIQHIAIDEDTNTKKWIEKLIINEVIRRGGKKNK